MCPAFGWEGDRDAGIGLRVSHVRDIRHKTETDFYYIYLLSHYSQCREVLQQRVTWVFEVTCQNMHAVGTTSTTY